MGRNLILQAEYKHKKQPICAVPAIHSQNKGKLSLPANKLVGSSINYFHWIIQFKTKIIERINYFTLKPALNYIDMKFHKQTSGVMCADVAVCIDYHWESLQPQSSQKATFRSLWDTLGYSIQWNVISHFNFEVQVLLLAPDLLHVNPYTIGTNLSLWPLHIHPNNRYLTKHAWRRHHKQTKHQNWWGLGWIRSDQVHDTAHCLE